MTIKVITRFPSEADARQDAERVASMIRHGSKVQNVPFLLQCFQRPENEGGGFGYVLEVGTVRVVCRAITRYSVQYHGPEMAKDFDAVLVEDALAEFRGWMQARITDFRLALALTQGPKE